MYRGTTPKITFLVDIDTADLGELYITFKNEHGEIEKTTPDVVLAEGEISVYLSQADTLLFPNFDTPLRMQIRAKTKEGAAIASNIMQTTMNYILKDGEI